ncbi:MAG: glycosyltransferase family 39 protein [Pseudomonadota bacterium]
MSYIWGRALPTSIDDSSFVLSQIQACRLTSHRNYVLIAVAAITLLGFLVRWWTLADHELWLDELLTGAFAHYPAKTIIFGVIDTTPPLYYLLHKIFVFPADDVVSMRLLPLIFGTMTIPVIFLLGRSIAGNAVGLWAAAMLAVWDIHVHHSQDARAYALLFLLVALSATALAHGMRLPGTRRTLLYGTAAALAALAFATHFTAILWICILGATMLLDARFSSRAAGAGPAVLRAAVIGLFLSLPTVFHLLVATSTQSFSWLKVPTFNGLLATWQVLFGPRGEIGIANSILAASMVCGGIAVLSRRGNWQAAILLGCLAAIPAMEFLVSQLKPILMVRTAIVSVIGCIVASAIVLAALPRMAAGVLGGLVVAGQMYALAVPQTAVTARNGVAEGASYLTDNVSAGDVVVFASPMAHAVFVPRLPGNFEGRLLTGNWSAGKLRDYGVPAADHVPWQHRYLSTAHVPNGENPFAEYRPTEPLDPFDQAVRGGDAIWFVQRQGAVRKLTPDMVAKASGLQPVLVQEIGRYEILRFGPSLGDRDRSGKAVDG